MVFLSINLNTAWCAVTLLWKIACAFLAFLYTSGKTRIPTDEQSICGNNHYMCSCCVLSALLAEKSIQGPSGWFMRNIPKGWNLSCFGEKNEIRKYILCFFSVASNTTTRRTNENPFYLKKDVDMILSLKSFFFQRMWRMWEMWGMFLFASWLRLWILIARCTAWNIYVFI